jgi:hypothetical protein
MDVVIWGRTDYKDMKIARDVKVVILNLEI